MRSPGCLLLLAALLLSACSGPPPRPVGKVADAVPRAEPRSKRGNPHSYVVFGKRYYVMNSANGYAERGIASWYGPKFHGEMTSSGERYDMYAMTAAHKTLPLPAYVRVTHLGNGKSVVVRVNDRGPFVDGRIIDLSYAAATQLDMVGSGTAPVEVVVVGTGPEEPVRPIRPVQLFAQAGAFGQESNARELAARLEAAGVGPVQVRRSPATSPAPFKVHIGPLASATAFDELAALLKGLGVMGALLVTD